MSFKARALVFLICCSLVSSALGSTGHSLKSPISWAKQGGWLEQERPTSTGGQSTPVVVAPPRPQVTLPDSDECWEHGQRGCRVEWNGLTGSLVKVEMYKGTTLVGVFSDWENNDGSAYHSSAVPSSWGSGMDFRVRVVDNVDNELWSDWFQISAPIDVSEPNTLTRWSTNQPNPRVMWSGAEGTLVTISLLKSGRLIQHLASEEVNDGEWEYLSYVPAAWGDGSGYQIEISDNLGNSYLSQQFSIDPIYVSNPGSETIWYKGRTVEPVEWTGGTSVAQVDLYRGNSLVQHLSDGWVDNNNQMIIGNTVPETWAESPTYRIKVTSMNAENQTVVGWSDYFEVKISNDVPDGAETFTTRVSSDIGRPGDTDYWKFRAERDVIYDFTVTSSTPVAIEVLNQDGDDALASDDNRSDMEWYCRRSGTYLARINALDSSSTGTYTAVLEQELPPEKERNYFLAATAGMAFGDLSDVLSNGTSVSFGFVPISFTEIGGRAMFVRVQEEAITSDQPETLNYLGGYAGLRSPEFARLIVRGGVGYMGKISNNNDLFLRHEYADYLDSINGGMRSYFGIDYKATYNRFGSALYIRLEQVLTQGSQGITSVGLNFAF